MGSKGVVDLSPLVDHRLSVFQREKDILIETLISKLAIEGLDKSVLLGLAWLNKVDL